MTRKTPRFCTNSPPRYGSYIAYYYDPGHTNEVGCKYNDNDCNYETDEITVLNLVMALLSNVSNLEC